MNRYEELKERFHSAGTLAVPTGLSSADVALIYHAVAHMAETCAHEQTTNLPMIGHRVHCCDRCKILLVV